MRRACIVEVASSLLNTIVSNLPEGICYTVGPEEHNRAVVQLRLHGDVLPDWCTVRDGEYLPRARIRFVMQFEPVS